MGVVYGKPNGVVDRAGRFGGAGGSGGNSNVIINIMGDPITGYPYRKKSPRG